MPAAPEGRKPGRLSLKATHYAAPSGYLVLLGHSGAHGINQRASCPLPLRVLRI